IEIADGEYLMADTMLPHGETLIREILFGKKYAKQKFGVDVPVMWGADSFGFNAQLPQVYKKAGYKYFAFRRGVDRARPSEFWWEGLDGTRILAHWMPLGYRAGMDLTALEATFNKLKEAATTRHILMPSGSGVTLPQPDTSRAVKKWNRTHHDSKMKITSSADFFKHVEGENPELEVRRGELYSGKFSEVFPNTASTRMWLKQELRKYESLIFACEKWASIAWILGVPYPDEELRENWKKVLWGAFHDVVPGTGIDEAYIEAKDNFVFLQTHLPQIVDNFLSLISQGLQNQDDIVVFNPLSWEVKNWVEAELWFKSGQIKRIEGLKSGTEEIELEILESTQYVDGSYQTVRVGFVATVPALGYRTYKILRRNPRSAASLKTPHRANTIENKFFRLKVDPSNGLMEVFQKGKQIVKGNDLVLDEEVGDLYYHRQNLVGPLKTEGDQGVKYGKFRMKSFRIDKTPLRQVVSVESDYFALRWPYRLVSKFRPLMWRHNYMSVSKKTIIYNDLPRIDFVTTVHNRHPQVRLRMKFPTGIDAPRYHAETQFGVVSRPVDQFYAKSDDDWSEKPCGEYPSLHWIDYSDKDKGVSLLNRGLPAHEIRDGAIYLTLLRSVLMLSSDGETGPAIPTPDAQEAKTYTFEYSLYPHQGNWKDACSFKVAQEYCHLPTARQLSAQKGKRRLPTQLSFVHLKPDNLILVAMKRAEDGSGVVLRFFETTGEDTRGEIELFREPKSVMSVNLLEEEEGDVRFTGKKIPVRVKPFEIVSLKIGF
ncbi:MAG: glycoside hydrolase family 38 C-terminal domain-containing protein, partial [Dehalococcoidia bacterium]|nr:glycoside hydrolase family 38 C-terminal domain-containing protein [Dehalococcoidia bacterium]